MTLTCVIMAHRALRDGFVTAALENVGTVCRLQQVLMTTISLLAQPASHVALLASLRAQVLPHTELCKLFICCAKNSSDIA
jgi:hypothetical protein